MDGDEYREYVTELFKGHQNEQKALDALGKENTDWQKEIFRTAISHDHNLTVTGSLKDFLPFRLSLGYTDQQGIVKTTDFKRFTLAGNVSPSFFNDHLNLNINAKYMFAKSRFADTGGAIGNAIGMDPTQPISVPKPNQSNYSSQEEYEEALISWQQRYGNFGGYFNWLSPAEYNDDLWPLSINTNAPRNPIAILELRNDRANSHSFVGNIDADYKVHGFEDLRLHLTLGGDFSKGKQTTDVDPTCPQAPYYGSHGWEEITKENRTLSAYAQYYKDFNDDHHFDIMAGYEWQHFWHKKYNNYWGYYPNDIFDNNGNIIHTAGEKYKESWTHYDYKNNYDKGFRTEQYLISFFGRMNYIFKNRYYLTATVRRDGTSRFKNHWSTFPSFAFAWRIKEEGFLRDNNALSDLKLRLGWGKTGQQEIGSDYNYFANYKINTMVDGSYYDIMGDGTMARPNVYNPNLKWETTTTTNVGLDWGFLNGRLTGSIDWYYRKTTDLLNNAYIPVGNFSNKADQNIGSLRNTGLELSISWKAISTKDWLWAIDYNFTYNNNKITELEGGDDPDFKVLTGPRIGINNNIQAHHVGNPASSFYVYQQVYDTNGKPIEGQLVDRNADGKIDDNDRYYYKSPHAPVTMGLSSRLEWKNWDFGFNLRASFGNYVFNNVMQSQANVGYDGLFRNVSGWFLNNRLIETINTGWTTFSDQSQLSDYWVQNASFLKCDNITLGYSFNEIFKGSKYHGLAGRVYGTVSNVFCITKYKGLDPECGGGYDNNNYPRPISFILGLSLNF